MTMDIRQGHTSASNAAADRLCPGRHLAQRGLPEVDTEDAKSGRVVHEALKKRDPAGLTVEQAEVYAMICKLEDQFLNAFFGSDLSKVQTVREERFWVRFKSPDRPDVVYEHSGQPDVVHKLGTRAFIFEYKTLPGDVPEAADNPQLRDQVALVKGKHPILDGIAVVPLQPLVTMSPVPAIYDAPAMEQATAEMYQRIVASNDPAARRIAGDVQCKFCKARFLCHEHTAWASSLVPNMQTLAQVPVSAWTPDQRAIFLDRVSVAEKWLEETKESIRNGLQVDPNFATGYMLTPGRKTETIADPEECFRRFAALGGTQEQFMKAVAIGKTRLKKALSEATGAIGMALNKAMDGLTKDIVTVKVSVPLIVKQDEGHKAITPEDGQ